MSYSFICGALSPVRAFVRLLACWREIPAEMGFHWKCEYYCWLFHCSFVIAVDVAVAKYNVETFPFPGVG